MDQAEYKEILGMINSVTKFFDFRLVDEQGSHFNSLGVVLLGVLYMLVLMVFLIIVT